MKRHLLFAVVLVAGFAQLSAFAAYNAAGGYVTLLGHNSGSKGESTFMTNIVKASYGWSDGRDPHPGTNYYCGSSAQLCTPKITDGTFTFPGDSLVIGYRLITLATSTIVVNDLRFEKGGYVMTMNGGELSLTLQGNLTILGDASKPSSFDIGKSPSHFKVESAFKGTSSAYAYSSQADASSGSRVFTSFDTQYIELDDADEYYGTFEVRTNTCLKLASDMPGTVKVTDKACLTPVGSVKIANLSLADGATLDFSGGGTISVTNSWSALGLITVKSPVAASYPQVVLEVPTSCGRLDVRSFTGDCVRFDVLTENGIQKLRTYEKVEYASHTDYSELTGYVTQTNGSSSYDGADAGFNAFGKPDGWSDGWVPHADTNYYSYLMGMCMTTNSTFGGKSFTVERLSLRFGKSGITIDIPDLRVLGGSSYANGFFSTSGNSGTYYVKGNMTVLSRLTDKWPFAFYGGADNLYWISSQKIFGDALRAFALRAAPNKEPGSIDFYVDFLGDLSEYYGTIIVSTNGTARLGGSALPGTIRLDTAYSHVDTLAADGAEVKIGNLQSLIGTSISVAATNTLAVTDSLAVTGTLTKNGGGVLASGGAVTAGAGAVLSVAAGGLRADSAQAFDGIPITFADGATYVRDCEATDAGLVQYGLYDEAAVTAAGTLNVDLRNFSLGDAGKKEVALFTVPEAGADALAAAIRFSPRPKGYAIDTTVADAGSGMKTVKAVIKMAGITVIIR
jgi:hypothetical protein